MDRKICALWLHTIPGIGKAGRRQLLDYAGEEEAVYRLTDMQLKEILTVRQQALFAAWKKKYSPKQLQAMLEHKGIDFVPQFAEAYPQRLKQIPDAPYALYVRGGLPEDRRSAVAVIGARQCTEYGRRMARWFAEELVAAGVQIVSGLARGIDGISQQAALKAGGASYGVLGCGVDICYPPENEEIFRQCMESGGILSEYPPGTEPRAGLFPARNRIISGLSDALLVIEAREKSGTLITVDMALEQGREVFALPGRANDALSCGCNRLIRQGAELAAGPQDVLAYLGSRGCILTEGAKGSNRKESLPPVGKFHQMMWLLLEENPQSFCVLHEAFRRQSGMENVTPSETAGLLADLVLDGLAGEKGRNCYYRI